jgi:hypothetical protein
MPLGGHPAAELHDLIDRLLLLGPQDPHVGGGVVAVDVLVGEVAGGAAGQRDLLHLDAAAGSAVAPAVHAARRQLVDLIHRGQGARRQLEAAEGDRECLGVELAGGHLHADLVGAERDLRERWPAGQHRREPAAPLAHEIAIALGLHGEALAHCLGAAGVRDEHCHQHQHPSHASAPSTTHVARILGCTRHWNSDEHGAIQRSAERLTLQKLVASSLAPNSPG